MSAGIALADSATTRRPAVDGSARSRRSTSRPSMSGSCMSTSTSPGSVWAARATPLAPSGMLSNSMPARRRTSSATIITLTALSSM